MFAKRLGGIALAKKKGGNTVETVTQLVKPIVEGFGLELWDVRYVKEGAQWYLRIFIDSENGISIDDCEKVSRAIDAPLDEADPIDGEYCLEVCSPGIERELVKDEHFLAYIGADVMVKMIRPIEGIGKEFCGKLKSYEKNEITIEDHSGENEVTFGKKDAVYVKLDDFD
ncbi:MAG: ribosome maturation factor RimP [Clostridia bacterium]|nr:ribosome maturation factor RimP [Clostridia bacterium]